MNSSFCQSVAAAIGVPVAEVNRMHRLLVAEGMVGRCVGRAFPVPSVEDVAMIVAALITEYLERMTRADVLAGLQAGAFDQIMAEISAGIDGSVRSTDGLRFAKGGAEYSREVRISRAALLRLRQIINPAEAEAKAG